MGMVNVWDHHLAITQPFSVMRVRAGHDMQVINSQLYMRWSALYLDGSCIFY